MQLRLSNFDTGSAFRLRLSYERDDLRGARVMPVYTFTTLDHPSGTVATGANGINDAGQIVGVYIDASRQGHGFLLSGGTFTTLDDPSAGPGGTFANGINAA